jgi:predicted transcriptional regulator
MSLLKDKKIVYEYNVDHTEGLVEVIEKIPDDLFNKLKKIIKNKSVKVNRGRV